MPDCGNGVFLGSLSSRRSELAAGMGGGVGPIRCFRTHLTTPRVSEGRHFRVAFPQSRLVLFGYVISKKPDQFFRRVEGELWAAVFRARASENFRTDTTKNTEKSQQAGF